MIEANLDEDNGAVMIDIIPPMEGRPSDERDGNVPNLFLAQQTHAAGLNDSEPAPPDTDTASPPKRKISAKMTSAPSLFLPPPVAPPEKLLEHRPVSAPRLFVQPQAIASAPPAASKVPKKKKKGWLHKIIPTKAEAPRANVGSNERHRPRVYVQPPIFDVDRGDGQFYTRQTLGVPMAQPGMGSGRTLVSQQPTKRSQSEEFVVDGPSLNTPRVFAQPPTYDVDLSGKGEYHTRKTLGVPML